MIVWAYTVRFKGHYTTVTTLETDIIALLCDVNTGAGSSVDCRFACKNSPTPRSTSPAVEKEEQQDRITMKRKRSVTNLANPRLGQSTCERLNGACLA